ncbi:Hypothetical_protein [Hexamita inflata]|uniref:Hypothetical_protein n=1 Tax=Hexamita inflata TaxID=28002 RepID=A0AA86NX42_9EUKA|nr:Hypothetical protein HINF_LOCUS14573 [Hexamita inflata]
MLVSHLLRLLRYRMVDGFWMSLAFEPYGNFIPTTDLHKTRDLGSRETWSSSKMFKQYDQLSLEMFQKEHINILAKDEKNPTVHLIISPESTILKQKQKDIGNRQLLKSKNFQPPVKMNVKSCMNQPIEWSYLYTGLLIQMKSQIQNSRMPFQVTC